MDHKVSKDMISSGMIPSGEKTQADLGRTQYGSAPSPSSLMEAYRAIYEHHQKDENGNTIPHEDEDIKEENLDEMNAGYSTDAGLASTANMKPTTPVKKKESGREMLYRLGRGPRPKSLGPTKSQQMRKALIAKKQEASSPTQGKPMPSNPQLKSQVSTSANTSALNVSATKRPTSVRKRGGGVKTNPVKPFEKPNRQVSGRRGNRPQARGGITFQKPQPSGSNKRAEMSKRRSMMNDVDLFDLIKGAFIEEGYNESDALSFMVEANQEYLTELDREMTMLGVAGASAIPFVAKKLFGKKVDKAIDKQRKTSPIGGDNRAKKIEKAAGAEGFFK